MKARLLSVLLVIALLVTVGVITAQAAADPRSGTYASLNTISDNAQANLTTTADAGSFDAYCPVCDATKTWAPLPAAKSTEDGGAGDVSFTKTTNTHWYVPVGGLEENSATYTVTGGKHCVHLNGQNIISSTTVFAYGDANSEGVNILGTGNVTTTSAEPTYTRTPDSTGSAGQMSFYGGTHSNTGGGLVVQHGTGYIRFLLVTKNVHINGTVNAAPAGSVRVTGGTINTLIGPALASGNANSFRLEGAPVINSLTYDSTLKPAWTSLTENAAIGLPSDYIGKVIHAADAEADLETLKTYFRAAESDICEVVIKVTEAGRYYITLAKKDGVATCAACGELAVINKVSEAEAGELAAGHYKLTADLELDGPLTVAADVCIDLNGRSVTSTGRVVEQTAGTLNVVGTGSTVTGAAAEGDAATILVSGGTLNLKGGTYKHTNASTLPTLYIVDTGNKDEDVTHTLKDVTLTADEGVTGTNLSAKTCKIDVQDSIIENGVAPSTSRGGGNIYAIGANINFRNSIIRDGIATDATRGGGNVYTETGSLKYSNTQVLSVMPADITEGTTAYTAEQGGNIYHRSGIEVFYDNSVISGGYAETNGGSVFFYAGTMQFMSGTYTGGMAERGAFLAQIAPSMYAEKGSELSVFGGTFNEGVLCSNADRGKIFLVRSGNMTLTGGTFNSTSTGTSGKETGCAINVASTGESATLILTEATVTAYKAPEIVINDQYPGNAIRVSSNANSHVKVFSRFNDDISLLLEEADLTYGATYAGGTYTDVSGVDYTGSVSVSSVGGALLLPDGNGGLVVAGAKADGQWTTTADAFANADDSIILYQDGATVEITEETALVDLNGKSITVNGTGKLNAVNNSTSKAGQVTLGGTVTTAATGATWDTDHYDIVNVDGNTVTFHKLQMKIKSISLRPGTAGLYYTCEILMDDTLKAAADEIGIVLAVGEGVVVDGENKGFAEYILGLGNDLVDDKNVLFVGTNVLDDTVNSVLVNNILKDGADNAERAALVVHGAPVVVLEDGTTLIGQVCKSYSMKGYMEFADTKFADLTKDAKDGLKGFYDTWATVMSGWAVSNIAGHTA